jgi:hypothetical protein
MEARRVIGIVALVAAVMTNVSAQRPSSEQADNARSEVEFGIAMAQQGLWQEALFRFELDPHHPSIKRNYTLFLEIDDRRIRPLPNTAAVRHAGTADANDAPRDAGAAP